MASISDHGSLRTNSRFNSSSPRGHISPLHEASTLLSPDQLHRGSPVQKRDTLAIVEDIKDGNETQPSLSPILAPSNLDSLREGKVVRSIPFRRATHWKTVGMIIGFLFAGLLSALGHYFLFGNLDGKLTDTCYLTQSQASAVSILLTTIFKAALTASTGICFAQHLWFILRGNAMPLSAIEKLFVFRTNILVLSDLRSIWRAPMLFLMALLVWCLGLATIYPPGALIVTFEAHNYTENCNTSVMNPPIPQDLDIGGNVTFRSLSQTQFAYTVEGLIKDSPGDYNQDEDVTGWTYRYNGTQKFLVNIARSIITKGEVFDLLVHPGENSTYNLRFRAPQFQCTVSQDNITIPVENIDVQLNNPGRIPSLTYLAFEAGSLTLMVSELPFPYHPAESLLYTVRKYTPHNILVKRTPNTTTLEAFGEVSELNCRAHSTLYDVNISFSRGGRTIEHTVSDPQAIPSPMDLYDEYEEGHHWGIDLSIPAEPQALEKWRQKIFAALPLSNEWALIHALSTAAGAVSYSNLYLDKNDDCIQSDAFGNGTRNYICEDLDPSPNWSINTTVSPLQGTVFHPRRFDPLDQNDYLDPRYDLSFTEDLLNSVLTNLTLSAISLGTWWDVVPVSTTRYQSTYSFANPLNLILPYSVCLAAATLFAAVAIWSLWRNGIPAADNGFLQIMMATRGNTEMERLVLRERLTAIENMSAELKSLKIRYGELVGEDVLGAEGTRMGFGTVEETVSLRKRE